MKVKSSIPSLWLIIRKALLGRNPLEVIMVLFSHQEISWWRVSSSSCLSPDILFDYQDKLDWDTVSHNPCITHLDIDPETLGYYESDYECSFGYVIDLSQCEESLRLGYEVWTARELSGNETVTADLIKKYPERFDWDILRRNPALPTALLVEYIDTHTLGEREWREICDNPAFTPDLIEQYIDKVDWSSLSRNPSFTPDLIEQYVDLVNWRSLAYNESLTAVAIEQYADEWDWKLLSGHPALEPDLIVKYRQELDFDELSKNRSLTPELVRLLEDELSWGQLSKNPVMADAELIQEYFIDQRQVLINKTVRKSCLRTGIADWWCDLSWNCLENNLGVILDHLDWPWDFTPDSVERFFIG